MDISKKELCRPRVSVCLPSQGQETWILLRNPSWQNDRVRRKVTEPNVFIFQSREVACKAKTPYDRTGIQI